MINTNTFPVIRAIRKPRDSAKLTTKMHWVGKVAMATRSYFKSRIGHFTGWADQGLFVIHAFIDSIIAWPSAKQPLIAFLTFVITSRCCTHTLYKCILSRPQIL
jgi:hypothetical protein